MSDLISRQDAIDAFDCTNELIVGGKANARNVVNYINKVVGKIKDLPSAQPERTGKWLEIPHTFLWQCSLCSWINDISSDFNYCPDCGARMEVKND